MYQKSPAALFFQEVGFLGISAFILVDAVNSIGVDHLYPVVFKFVLATYFLVRFAMELYSFVRKRELYWKYLLYSAMLIFLMVSFFVLAGYMYGTLEWNIWLVAFLGLVICAYSISQSVKYIRIYRTLRS